MNIHFDTERWTRDLAKLSFRHKTLMILLESLADPSGVVVWAQDTIEGLAGEKFLESDVDALGYRIVWLDRSKILLPSYMKTQYKTLSRSSPAHRRVWKCLRQHWGERGDLIEEPFVTDWKARGIDDWLPAIGNERIGKQTPEWYLKLMERAKGASQCYIPKEFPEVIKERLLEFFAYRFRKAEQTLNVETSERWDWSINHARTIVNETKRQLTRHTETAIAKAITSAMSCNYRAPIEPRSKFEAS